jgi:ribosomal protein L11 methyltransferase
MHRAMHEIALIVDAAAVDDVIDRVIADTPYGIFDQAAGDAVVLRIRGRVEELMATAELAALAGRGLLEVQEREVPDDWRERRLLDWEPVVVGKVSVRPPWAPPAEGLIDVVIDEGDAFGTGSHPTTRACLELLCGLAPGGPLADLGCGSGVLAVAAAKLGWAPVTAVDVRESAVRAARDGAALNEVEIDVQVTDLLSQPPPFAPTICANVPPVVHRALARGLPGAPAAVIASGFATTELGDVASCYRELGLEPERTIEESDWVCCLFKVRGTPASTPPHGT